MLNNQDSIKASTANDNIESFYNPPGWSQGHISLDDAMFLDKLVRDKKPEEVIEVGVASGCSSAVLLRALAVLGGPRVLHSYDIVDYCYFAPERRVGEAVDELAQQFSKQWSLNAGCTAIDAGARLGGHNVKMAFIDADHRHPCATLDLWALLPALAADGWVALHDVTLARNSEWKVYGPEILFESWPGEKIKLSDSSNIGAIRLPGDCNQARLWLMESLRSSWEMDIEEHLLDQLDIPHTVRPKRKSFQKISKCWRDRFMELIENGRDLIIWGAAEGGRRCLAEFLKEGIRPVAFVDSNESRHGQHLKGIPIHSPRELNQFNPTPFVIVASVHASEIIMELDKMGFDQMSDMVCYIPGLPKPGDMSEANECSPNLLGMTTMD
jgi:predicted O-methyltransferase YrrM